MSNCEHREQETHIMVTYSYRGVEYQFVSTAKQLLDELKCPICLELVSDPVQTSCGHLFCGKCIIRSEKCICPVDRERFTSHADTFNDRRVRNFKVKCPNNERVCQWQGCLGDVEEHTDADCDYQIVDCDHIDCEVKVERRWLAEHMQAECLQRMEMCSFCNENDTHVNLKVTKTHLTVCEHMPLPCPAGCDKQGLVRGSMADHLSDDCPNELVPCTYAAAGCQQIVKRKDLQQHLQDKETHFQAVMESYTALSLLVRDLAYAVKYGNNCNIHATPLPIPFRPWLHTTPTCYPRPPCVIMIEAFHEKMKNGEGWFSDPVYSHFGGYKMCLKVSVNGLSDGQATHVSVLIYWMRGDNDANLKWPFRGTIKVSLLNQLEDGQHFTKLLWSPNEDVSDDCCGGVTGKDRSSTGWGYTKFISYQDLKDCDRKECHFLKDDTLFFRVDCFEQKLD